MKKLAIALLAIVLYSCGAADENGFQTQVGTATIEGIVKYDNDEFDPDAGLIPLEGAVITVTYSSADLSLTGANGVTLTKSIVDSTNASGRFTIEVPAIPNATTYTVSVRDFIGNYTRVDAASTTVPQGSEIITALYTTADQDVSAIEGAEKFVVLTAAFDSDFE